MRRGVRRVLVLAVLATAAGSPGTFAQNTRTPAAPAGRPRQVPADRPQAANAAARPQAAPNDPRMKSLLETWEKRSAQIKTLDVDIKRLDKSAAWGEEQFVGRALLKSPNRAWLDFNKVERDENGKPVQGAGGKPKLTPEERIICTGTEVWQYRPQVKQIFIFPLDKKNQQRALEEGPLPFLFNMRAAEAEARYEMKIANEEKDRYIISVVPRLKVDREAFSKAFIQLKKSTYLPDRIFLVSPDGNSTKDFQLNPVKPNVLVHDDNFKGVDLGKPWQVIRDPGEGVTPKGAAPKVQGLGKRQSPGAGPLRRAAADRRAPVS